MKKILSILMLLALSVFAPHEAKAYCFTYSKTVGFTDPSWVTWGSWVQPSSFINAPSRPSNYAWIHLDRLESAGRYGVLDRVFTLGEVNNVVVTPGLVGCPSTHLPPDPVLNRLKACQATAWVAGATGDKGVNISLQMIDPEANQYITIKNYHYFTQPSPSAFRITTGLVTTPACVPNVLVRIVLTSSPPASSDLLIRDARVDYYTN